MSLPGFTAEVSLHRTLGQYFFTTNSNRMSSAVNPAMMNSLIQPAACNYQGCWEPCQFDCVESCSDFIGSARSRCVTRCSRDCDSICGCKFFH
jgi:hypothetical protein